MKSKLRRLTMNIIKSNFKVTLSRKKRDKFRKTKLNNKIKKHVIVLKIKNVIKRIIHLLQHNSLSHSKTKTFI